MRDGAVSTSAEQITIADIARVAEVRPAAVSNWRRRHRESFPRPRQQGHKELFSVAEVAAWLDGRKISTGDLRDGEPPGTTYGTRFRKKLKIPNTQPRATTDMLWRQLKKYRGLADGDAFADLILGLLYLRQNYPERWRELIIIPPHMVRASAEHAIRADEPPLYNLTRAIATIFAEIHGQRRLSDILQLLDSALPPTDQGDLLPEQEWAGDVFDRLLELFADLQGKRAIVVTPTSVVRTLIELVSPQPGESLFDPWCESGTFLVDAARYVRERGGGSESISLAGQAPHERSWSLARMNLALHGLSADLAARPGLVLGEDMHRRPFDVIVTNPPFNLRDWGAPDASDPRWRYGIPPKTNANTAWLQHIAWSLADGGRAAVIMPNGASITDNDRKIRAAMIEDGAIEAVIALPPQLFASTAIPVNVWLLRRERTGNNDEILFIDARALGRMVSRSRREVPSDDINRIVTKTQEWLSRGEAHLFKEELGFAASVPIRVVAENDYMLLPSRYVGVADDIAHGTAGHVSFEEVDELRRKLDRLHALSATADAAVNRQLERLGSCNR
jgi:type I restriction enzyme M protein